MNRDPHRRTPPSVLEELRALGVIEAEPLRERPYREREYHPPRHDKVTLHKSWRRRRRK